MSAVIDVSLVIVMALWQTGGSINVGWSRPTHYTDMTPITVPVTYNLYRSHNGGPYEKTAFVNWPKLRADITYKVTPGVVDCFLITATPQGGVESAYSRANCALPQ